MQDNPKIFHPSMKSFVENFILEVVFLSIIFVVIAVMNIASKAFAPEILYVIEICGMVGVLVLSYFIVKLSIKNTWVELHEDGLIIYEGIISKRRSQLLYSAIQDVKEHQGIIDSALGLKSLQVVTMTAESQLASKLPAFVESDADAIKQFVLSHTEKAQSPIEATVDERQVAREINVSQEKLSDNVFPLMTGRYLVILVASIMIPIAALAAIFWSIGSNSVFSLFNYGWYGIFILLGLSGKLIRLLTTKYSLSGGQIQIEYGLFSLNKITVPYRKIQDLIVKTGILERMLGLSSIRIETGAMDPITAEERRKKEDIYTIPALKKEDALKLRSFLERCLGYDTEESPKALSVALPLEKKKVIKKTIPAVIAGSIIMILMYAFLGPLTFESLELVAVSLISIIFLYLVYQIFYLKNYYYNTTSDLLIIRKGVIGWKEISVPYTNVQNIFVDQDVLDRAFGLWDVHLSTVTPRSQMEAHIDGLSQENAKLLANILLGQIKK